MELKFLGAGYNWTTIAAQLAHGAIFRLRDWEADSTASVTTTEPLLGCMEGPKWVAEGKFDVGITTPIWHVKMAIEGYGYYDKPQPLRVLGVLDHDDYLALGVRKGLGIRSIADIVERKIPLKISMPTKATHSPAGYVLEDLFAEYGFTVDDFLGWGGEIRIDQPGDLNFHRGKAIDEGYDAVFDEAIMANRWQRIATNTPMDFLQIEDDILAGLEKKGIWRGTIQPGRLPGQDYPIQTVDFRGWVIYCRADLPDEVAHIVVQGLGDGADRISNLFPSLHLGLSTRIDMHKAGKSGLLLHPGAQRYYDALEAEAA